MKALILAAGYGTRLLPFTQTTPKALFSIGGRPLLDINIHMLIAAGCDAIMVNTHHLPQKVEAFLTAQKYPLPVHTRHEPQILGTGGAVQNMADFWDNTPFMVINSDILTDIDLAQVYRFHLSHPYSATLVLIDDPRFNTVCIDEHHHINGFRRGQDSVGNAFAALTFTGIQVLDPAILKSIPKTGYANIIDVYETILSQGNHLQAFIASEHSWSDIGTPVAYRKSAFEAMAAEAFGTIAPREVAGRLAKTRLQGDGSDRIWSRLSAGKHSLIVVDHGIRTQQPPAEVDAFVSIGNHLHERGLPVPGIISHDTFVGLVFLEDLGDENLQARIGRTQSRDRIIAYYQQAVDILIQMSIAGAMGFDPAWACQMPRYDEDLILKNECRYFVEEFLNEYVGIEVDFERLADDFYHLAEQALSFGVDGFMHRDLQSRNIMVHGDRLYLIDFQGGRMGPLQYDLASLLIDPYVSLSTCVQNRLLAYCIKRLQMRMDIDPAAFRHCYKYCCLTRNLQILGAFAYLSRVKQKTYFEQYIPRAFKTLKQSLAGSENDEFQALKACVNELQIS